MLAYWACWTCWVCLGVLRVFKMGSHAVSLKGILFLYFFYYQCPSYGICALSLFSMLVASGVRRVSRVVIMYIPSKRYRQYKWPVMATEGFGKFGCVNCVGCVIYEETEYFIIREFALQGFPYLQTHR